MTACRYFALCDRDADGLRAHPVLGDVPICARCAERVGEPLTALERIAGVSYTDAAGDERNALEYLTTDAQTGEPTGHLHAPCSRYGRNGAECAPVAIALALIYAESSGDALSADDLEHAMGLVVNDHDDVAALLASYAHALPVDVADLLPVDLADLV